MDLKITSDDVVSVSQAAKELGKHRATIYRWVEDGTIVGIKLAGTLLIPRTEIERIKKQAVAA